MRIGKHQTFETLDTLLATSSTAYDIGDYLTPWAENNQDVDAIVFPKVFLQMTVSKTHPFQQKRVADLAKHLREMAAKKRGLVDPATETMHFIYVVPESLFGKFQPQTPVGTRGKALKTPDPNITQYVMAFPDSALFPNTTETTDD